MNHPDEETQGPVIRDRRRIDPLTGQVREAPAQASGPGRHSASQPSAARPAQDQPQGQQGQGKPQGQPGGQPAPEPPSAAAPGGGSRSDDAARTAVALSERTADLQRLQAEYANYRKRVERDRVAVREQALANVLSELLPVLDDIGRAREHGELTGGFKSVAESLESAVAKLGLTAYGEAGDPFDPTLHDALMHSYSAEVTEPTCVQILQPGYKVGDRIVRPARVAVAEPGGEADEADHAANGEQDER